MRVGKQGITILPALALKDLTPQQKMNVRYFKKPAPAREVGLATYRYFVKEKLIESLKEEILNHIPSEMNAFPKKELWVCKIICFTKYKVWGVLYLRPVIVKTWHLVNHLK